MLEGRGDLTSTPSGLMATKVINMPEAKPAPALGGGLASRWQGIYPDRIQKAGEFAPTSLKRKLVRI